MKRLLVLIIAITLSACHAQKKIGNPVSSISQNTIHFTKSDYGLIFTELIVNGKTVNAMIDFGDPNIIQLSSTFVDQENIIVTKKEGTKMLDINGNEFQVNEGTANQVKIGEQTYEKINFSSSPGEMESVSQQINTEFNAVVGWGYFKQYYVYLDYKNQFFKLQKQKFDISKKDISTQYKSDGSYLKIPISLNGNLINAILDTGSPVSVLDADYAIKNNIEKFDSKIGETKVDISYYTEDLSVLNTLDVKAIIGGDVMSQYKIYIDPFLKTTVLNKY